MSILTRMGGTLLLCAMLFLLGCESGTKKIVPKDDEATGDSDLLLGDEDGLLEDEDEAVTDQQPEGSVDTDTVTKDDAPPVDTDTTTPDTDVVPETCGNSQIDEGELCDGNLIDCVEIDEKLYSGGKASCLETCLGWDTITCDEIPYECGDGTVEGPEVCDTEGLTDCVTIDPMKYAAGKAYCLDDCSGYDTATCEEIETDDDTMPDTADVQPDPDTADDWIPDTTDVQPDLDTVDIDHFEDDVVPDTVDIDYFEDDVVPDTVDIDYFEDDVLPDVDTDFDGPCGSVRLDGSSGYVEVAHNALLNLTGNWTIEAWVNQDTNDAQSPILRKGSAVTYPAYYLYGTQFQLFYTSPPYGGYYYDTATSAAADGPSSPGTGEWYHIAFVKVGDQIITFINGVMGTAVTDSNNSYANTESLFFGTRQSSTPSYFDGLIDEIRISNNVRYSSSFTPQKRFTSDANTIGLWHFEDGAGSIADNAAGAGLNGTLTGGASWENACAAEGPIVIPDDDVMPDDDTVTPVIDTVGSTGASYSGANRMRGNYFYCDADRTLTEIEQYFSYSGSATIYFEIYAAETLEGTYYPRVSFTRNISMSGAGFYSSGAISELLEAGTYYYIGARWGSPTITYYADDTTTTGDYPTEFGGWTDGMVDDEIYSGPADIAWSSTNTSNAYYQRLTTQ